MYQKGKMNPVKVNSPGEKVKIPAVGNSGEKVTKVNGPKITNTEGVSYSKKGNYK